MSFPHGFHWSIISTGWGRGYCHNVCLKVQINRLIRINFNNFINHSIIELHVNHLQLWLNRYSYVKHASKFDYNSEVYESCGGFYRFYNPSQRYTFESESASHQNFTMHLRCWVNPVSTDSSSTQSPWIHWIRYSGMVEQLYQAMCCEKK